MKRNFITSALILSISSIFVRFVGFVFRVYLSNTLGAEGMGVYSLIMAVYGLCITLATSGISTAVSTMVAEHLSLGNPANARRVLRRAVGLSIVLGFLVGAILFVASDFIAQSILKDTRTTLSLKFLAPGLPFLSVSSCLRGYFIAQRHVGNPASAQIIEQGVKMAFIMLLLGYWLPRGLEYGCAVVVLGITIGEIVCLLYSAGGYLLERKYSKIRQKPTVNRVTAKILKMVGPIAIAAYVRAILRLVEDVLIMNGLRTFNNGSNSVATSTYGILKGMVMPLLIFPLNLLSSFVMTITPEISRLNATGRSSKLEFTVSRVLQYTIMAGVLVVSIFMTFSYQLGISIYKDEQVGVMLRQLSFLCPFMCIETVVVGILNGMGEQISSLRYNLSDCVLRLSLIYLLIPVQGPRGFMWMIIASNLFTSLLNLRRLLKVTRINFKPVIWVIRPVLAAAATSQIVKAIFNLYFMQRLSMWQGLALGIAIIIVVYGALMLTLGCVEKQDIEWIRNRLAFPAKAPKVEAEKAY